VTRALGAAGLGVAMLVAALAFGSTTLYLPSVALIALAGGAWAWVALAATGAGLERRGGPPTIEEERPWPLRLEVRAGAVRPPGGELVEPLLEHPIAVGQRTGRRVRVQVRFGCRGRRTLEPARLVLRDPLGLAERVVTAPAIELVVLPRIEPVLAGSGGGLGGATGRAGRPLAAAAEVELDSLRPYRPGAPAGRIHWPTVARTGEVFERRLAADADARPLVVLDSRRPKSEEALDSAVRAAASLAVHLARGGGCALILPGDRRATDVDPELRGWPALHVRLALVEPTDAAPVAGRLERSGAVFWVAASALGPPAGLRRAAAAARWLVTPVEADDAGPPPDAAFVVAGCAGRLIGHRHARRAA